MLYSISVCACSVTQSMAFSRRDCWSGLWFSPPGDLSDPGFEPASPLSPAPASGLFTPEPLVVQSLSCLWLFVTPWTAARQASLSITNFCSLLKLMSIESVMPSNHLILCHPLLLCLQFFPASGSFPVSQVFASGGQSIGVSALASVLPTNFQDWFSLRLTGCRCPSADEWIKKLWYIYTMEYYSAIKKNSFESVLMRWMKLEPIIQSEVSQKDKGHYSILTHIYGI